MCKNLLDKHNLRMLYFSMIHPFFTYENILWGSTFKKYLRPLETLQKKAIRVITHSNYNDHTEPLFRSLFIPKVDDINKILLGKFIYTHTNSLLPTPLQDIFQQNSEIHIYDTRQMNNIHFDNYKTTIMLKSFMCKGPSLRQTLPTMVKLSPTTKRFMSRIKKHAILQYSENTC